MRQTFFSLRRAAVVVIAVFSVLCAVALVWLSVRRETIGELSNAHLAGMLALFLLPAATLAAWELDRRSAQLGARDEAGPPEERPARKHGVWRGAVRRAQVEALRHRKRVVHGAGIGRTGR